MIIFINSSQKKPAEKTAIKESANKDKQKTADVKESSKPEVTKKEAESDKKARLLIDWLIESKYFFYFIFTDKLCFTHITSYVSQKDHYYT